MQTTALGYFPAWWLYAIYGGIVLVGVALGGPLGYWAGTTYRERE